jgi:hypothetical protein
VARAALALIELRKADERYLIEVDDEEPNDLRAELELGAWRQCWPQPPRCSALY